MKPIQYAICLALLPCAALAKDNAPAKAETQETEFRDPFATDSDAAKAKVSDPLEGMNRKVFHFNTKLYRWVLRPISKSYAVVAPKPVRVCLERLFTNAKFPSRAVNNMLEGRFRSAGVETARFMVNSTVGVAGLFDPAMDWKLKKQPADFNQTRGAYGIPSGIYLNLPFMGSSSVRGTLGMIGDAALNPTYYFSIPIAVSVGEGSLKTLNTTSLHIEEYDGLMDATLDPYVAARSAYYEDKSKLTEQ